MSELLKVVADFEVRAPMLGIETTHLSEIADIIRKYVDCNDAQQLNFSFLKQKPVVTYYIAVYAGVAKDKKRERDRIYAKAFWEAKESGSGRVTDTTAGGKARSHLEYICADQKMRDTDLLVSLMEAMISGMRESVLEQLSNNYRQELSIDRVSSG